MFACRQYTKQKPPGLFWLEASTWITEAPSLWEGLESEAFPKGLITWKLPVPGLTALGARSHFFLLCFLVLNLQAVLHSLVVSSRVFLPRVNTLKGWLARMQSSRASKFVKSHSKPLICTATRSKLRGPASNQSRTAGHRVPELRIRVPFSRPVHVDCSTYLGMASAHLFSTSDVGGQTSASERCWRHEPYDAALSDHRWET